MATTYLSRTPASAGSQTTWTFSAWVKKSPPTAGITQIIAQETGDYSSSGILTQIRFNSDKIMVANFTAGNYRDGGLTTQVFRDISGWYHIVVNFNSTDATLSNRIKVYVNGEEAAFNFDLGDTAQNAQSAFNTTNQAMAIGATLHTGTPSGYFDGSMTHVHFIDGTAYDASAFGETDATTGIWKPKGFNGSYGTNGFFLKFENSGAMGTDSSGNSNNFTVNGTMTQTIDTPSNVFATWNPLDRKATGTPSFANGNLYFSHSENSQVQTRSTLAFSKGKYYAEFKITSGDSYTAFGIAEYDTGNNVIADSNDGALLGGSGYLSGGAIANGDIIGIAIDADNQTCKWYINNSLEATYDYSAKTGLKDSTSLCFGVFSTTSSGTNYTQANFGNGYFGTSAISSPSSDDNGNGLFTYAPPTGYLALCTKSINAQEYS